MSDERFNRIETKVDALKDFVHERLNETNQHLAVYNEQLKIHIKGTEDNRVEIKAVRKELEPIKDHVKLMGTVGKIAFRVFATIGAIVTVTEAVLKIRELLGH